MQPRLVLCTCPDSDSAERLARTLVAERLAACVSVAPGLRSVYRWGGAVECGEEVQLLVKTTADRSPLVFERIRALHPYELPEIIAVDIVAGLEPYLDWVVAETRLPAGGATT